MRLLELLDGTALSFLNRSDFLLIAFAGDLVLLAAFSPRVNLANTVRASGWHG
jgi:hypothetical protein